MKKRIDNFIIRNSDIKPEELSKFSLLFFHSFFLGLFIAFYFVPANSVFIQHFGSEHLPEAYIVSGIVGYFISIAYSFVQNRFGSLKLFLGALLFMFFLSLAARLALGEVSEKWLSFFIFVWAWPFISLSATESGGLALRFLNLRQVKRLFGLINIGGIIASILGYFAISLFMKFIGHAYNLLYIAVIGLVISIFFLLLIYKRFPQEKATQENDSTKSRTKTRFLELIKKKYFVLIFLSTTISTIVIYITDFGFLASIKAQKELLPTAEDVSKFIAIIFGILKVGELVFSYFSGRILSRYGVKLGLSILPVVSLFLVTVAFFVESAYGVASILFFAVMILNKSMERILRRSLDDPSFNILYQPLPEDLQLSVQTKVGVFMQVSTGIAGVLLWLVSVLLRDKTGFDLSYFPMFFLPILVIWIFVAVQLYRAYKAQLRKILIDKSRSLKRDVLNYRYAIDSIRRNLKNKDLKIKRLSATFLAETNPRVLKRYSKILLASNDEIITRIVLKNIDSSYPQRVLASLKKISKNLSGELLLMTDEASERLNLKGIEELKPEEISKLAQSNKSDKCLSIKWLYHNESEYDEEAILHLFESNDDEIIVNAIKLSAGKDSAKLREKLVEHLDNARFRNISSSVLLENENSVGILDLLKKHVKKGVSQAVLFKVIEMYAKIGTAKALKQLVDLLNYADREVQIAVIQALSFCRYAAPHEDVAIIHSKVEEIIRNIYWIFITMDDLDGESNTLKLIQALEIERDMNFDLLFILLSFVYRPSIIGLIKKNVIGDNTIFALEIIENFFTQTTKQLVIPLVEKLSPKERIKRIQKLFPFHKMKPIDRLKNIIISDFSLVGVWTKIKAIEQIGRAYKRSSTKKIANNDDSYEIAVWVESRVREVLEKIHPSKIPDEIFVCLYHPDEFVYSTAAKIIYDENPARCITYLKTLSPEKQKLIKILESAKSQKLLLSERIKMLRRHELFFGVPENVLSKLAKLFLVKHLATGDKLYFKNDNNSEDIFIISRGTLSIVTADEELSFGKDSVIIRGLTTLQKTKFLQAKKNSIVLLANRANYFDLLVNETQITQHMFEMIKMSHEMA